jgi:23S rRNA (adenine2503-C2)-methyltransferase
MTGKQGFSGNLSSAEILNQILSVPETQQLTNFVFMGMGEPFDNYQNLMSALEIMTAPYGFALSPKRITVSTVGILPRLKQFLDKSRCHLAISIHSPFPEERLSMMPSEKAFPIKKILELLRQYDFSGQRRLSFEYIIFEGKNDGFEHAKELARLLKGMECRVNLIKFHSGDSRAVRWDSRLRGNDNTSSCHPREGGDPNGSITAFRDFLNAKGIIATIRASRGEDISAACGLLSGQHNSANN